MLNLEITWLGQKMRWIACSRDESLRRMGIGPDNRRTNCTASVVALTGLYEAMNSESLVL